MSKEEKKLNNFLSEYHILNNNLKIKKNYINQTNSLYNNLLKHIDSIIKIINDQKKLLLNSNNNKDENIYNIIELINDTFETMMNSDKRIIKEIISYLTTIIDKIKKEKKKYDLELESIYNEMKKEKEKMEIEKKLFHQNMQDTEAKLLKELNDDDDLGKKKLTNDYFESREYLKESKNNYLNYKTSNIKINEIINQFNNKEIMILDIFDDLENGFDELASNILNKFYENQCSKNNLSSKNKNKIKEMIIINNNYILNKRAAKNDIAIKNRYSINPLNFEDFQSNINFLNIENNKEFYNCIFVIKLLQKTVGDVYPNISLEKEEKKNENREKISNIINQNNNKIIEEDKNELYSLLNDNEDYQKIFINILNKSRINGNFNKNKDIINIIGHSLNIIINYSSINKSYNTIKNCIVLSQTFFYEDDNKKKRYIFELIKDNKWLHNEDFWRNHIDLLIVGELVKLQNLFNDEKINVFIKKNIPDKMLNKIEESLFAQLIPSVNNMVEFNVDVKIIIKIIEELIHKYNYLSQKKIDYLFTIISDNKEEIEKIRENVRKELSIKCEKNNNKDP